MDRAYIPYVHIFYTYIPRTGHTCMQHAHACAAKQSELVRRCIATTCTLCSPVHPAGGQSPPTSVSGRLACLSLPVSRHYEQTHTRTRFGFVRGSVSVAKERVIASGLSRSQCSRDPFGKPWNCVSYREIDRVNCAPVGERVPDLRPCRAAESSLGFQR